MGNCARTCQIEQAVQPRDDRGRSDTPVPVPRKSADVSGIRRPPRTPRARRVHRARVRVLETTRTGAWSRARRGSARASPGSGRAVRVVVRSGKLERTTRPRALGDDRHGRRGERRARPRARGRPLRGPLLGPADAFVVRVVLVRPRRHPPRARVLRPPPVARPTGTPRAPRASSSPSSSTPPRGRGHPTPRPVLARRRRAPSNRRGRRRVRLFRPRRRRGIVLDRRRGDPVPRRPTSTTGRPREPLGGPHRRRRRRRRRCRSSSRGRGGGGASRARTTRRDVRVGSMRRRPTRRRRRSRRRRRRRLGSKTRRLSRVRVARG